MKRFSSSEFSILYNFKQKKMSQFDEKMQLYTTAAAGLGLEINSDLLTGVAKSLGPSIYLADASMVSSSDKSELETVKNKFLIGKLGLEDGPDLDAGIDAVVGQMGSSNSNKHRPIFYSLLAMHFGKEDQFM